MPETVELPPGHAAALAEHADALAAAGLEGEPFGDGTFLLRTVPRLLRGQDAGALLRAMAGDLVEEGATDGRPSGPATPRSRPSPATAWCGSGSGSTRRGARAAQAMDGVAIAAHCPHGRPVAAEMTGAQLEAMFRR